MYKHINGQINMKIFSYDSLILKAKREITRLIQAELNFTEEVAIDHALNAAFTIYHLIQWGQQEKKICSTNKVHDYILNTNNNGLKVLHDVVTSNKHVTVSKPAYGMCIEPTVENNIIEYADPSGETYTAHSGEKYLSEKSYIKVFFGDQEALKTLKEALCEFC